MNRIDSTFRALKAREEKALIAYIMAGDPSHRETEALVLALEKVGVDILELGVPFSDPIADGPVIQRAADRALRGGASLRRILELVGRLRERTQIPLVLMLYFNTIHAFGEAAFCGQARAAGIDGLIVPDLPPEEAGLLATMAEQHALHLILLLAPTSTQARQKLVTHHSRGFLYYVSITGITGAQLRDIESVEQNVTNIRQATALPVVVGFGICTPEDISRITAFADGAVVGSAIVSQIEQHTDDPDMPQAVAEYVQTLKAATRRTHPAGALTPSMG